MINNPYQPQMMTYTPGYNAYPYNPMQRFQEQQLPQQPVQQVPQQQIQAGINGRMVATVEQIAANDVPMDGRDAEWHFLMGSVCYKRGWLNDAYSQFTMAVQMNPSNMEYQSALGQMNRQRGGYMSGNTMPNSAAANANTACNCCSSLICADCCCEACGGDLIPCC